MLKIQQFFAFVKENLGTAHIFGIPPGFTTLNVLVNTTPNINCDKRIYVKIYHIWKLVVIYIE